MRKKYGKHYADWRDEHGVRHMKAFDTKRAAVQFQTKQRNLTQAKKVQPSAEQSGRPPRRGRKASRPMDTPRAPQKPSRATPASSASTS